MFHYQTIDSCNAEAALAVMRRHGWYLVEEFQTFSLFSNKVVEDTKSSIAAKILTFEEKQPTTYPLAVPPFPTITPTTKLKDRPMSGSSVPLAGGKSSRITGRPESGPGLSSWSMT